jgi:hypothetical protein
VIEGKVMKQSRWSLPHLSLLLVTAVTGCVGQVIGPPGAPGGDPAARGGPVSAGMGGGPGSGGPTSPPIPGGPAGANQGRLRRLTAAQFRNSLHDLLGNDVTVGELEPDSLREGFASVGATYTTISARGIEQYDAAAQAAAHQGFADPARRSQQLGCTPAGPDVERCVRAYLTGFGRRAWRRPLTPEEVDDYTKVTLDAAQILGDANQALEQVTIALLTSPNFLYRVEVGTSGGNGRFRYSGWELASRMSYFLWNSTPDDALLAAVEAGQLDTSAGLAVQAARLLQSPRARSGFSGGFGRDLLWLDSLADTPKNDPRFTDALKTSMETEVLRLFESRLDPGADVMDLLVSTKAFVDGNLAGLYGLPRPAGTGATVDLPASGPRGGLLGTAAFLSIYSAQDRTSPTARGVFVREKLLCQPMPTPPDNVNITLPTGNLTTRQRLEQHRANAGCRACHELFDPVGFAFESFDWIGAYRDREGGLPVDPSGNLDDFEFTSARELTAHLRDMPAVRDCLLKNLFRNLNGHLETDADTATLTAWTTAFDGAQRSLPIFLAKLLGNDDFRVVSNAP